jgi:hypothetical protein
MQYYSKSRKSLVEFRYFRAPERDRRCISRVDEWDTVRGKHRPVFVRCSPRGGSTGPRTFQVKRVKRGYKRRPRDRAHVPAARNHKGVTSILRRERIERIERARRDGSRVDSPSSSSSFRFVSFLTGKSAARNLASPRPASPQLLPRIFANSCAFCTHDRGAIVHPVKFQKIQRKIHLRVQVSLHLSLALLVPHRGAQPFPQVHPFPRIVPRVSANPFSLASQVKGLGFWVIGPGTNPHLGVGLINGAAAVQSAVPCTPLRCFRTSGRCNPRFLPPRPSLSTKLARFCEASRTFYPAERNRVPIDVEITSVPRIRNGPSEITREGRGG